MPANFDGTSAEPQPNKNIEDINNRKNKHNTSNKEQISGKEEQRQQRKSNHGLTILPDMTDTRTIKDQSKKKIQNGPLWPTTKGRTYRDHLWKIYTLVT